MLSGRISNSWRCHYVSMCFDQTLHRRKSSLLNIDRLVTSVPPSQCWYALNTTPEEPDSVDTCETCAESSLSNHYSSSSSRSNSGRRQRRDAVQFTSQPAAAAAGGATSSVDNEFNGARYSNDSGVISVGQHNCPTSSRSLSQLQEDANPVRKASLAMTLGAIDMTACRRCSTHTQSTGVALTTLSGINGAETVLPIRHHQGGQDPKKLTDTCTKRSKRDHQVG